MKISTARWSCLEGTLAAWQKTGLAFLLDYKNGIFPLENGCADEFGLYYFVPLLAKTFRISLESALWWWDCGLISSGVMVAISGFWLLTQTKLEKVIACIGTVAVGIVSWIIGDVYIAPFLALSLLPWLFVCLQRGWHKRFLVYCLVSGFMAAFSNSIRMYSGFALLLGVITALILFFKTIKKIWLPAGCLAMGFLAYSVWFSSLIMVRNTYLDEQKISRGIYEQQHLFWHSTYLGFGFLTNPYDMYYGDSCAVEHAQKIDPAIVCPSTKYNELLRKMTFQFCYDHPHFVMRTLFAKAGVLLYYLLICANIGLLLAFFYRKPWYVDIVYATVLVFSALPSLLTIPIAPYLTGFFTVATFYGIHSIFWAVEKGFLKDLKNFLKHKKGDASDYK